MDKILETIERIQENARSCKSALNELLACPFCGGTPVTPTEGIGGLFTYCSTILPKKESCPIGGVPMGVNEWQNRVS